MQDKPWQRNYDPGVPLKLDYPQIPAFGLLRQAALRFPKKACTISFDQKITFQEMEKLTNRLAYQLVRLGIIKGDRVGIWLSNRPEFVIAFFAILKAGGIVTAINALYKPREVINQVNDAQIRFLFTSKSLYPIIKEIQSQTTIQKIIVVDPAAKLTDADESLEDLIRDSPPSAQPETRVEPQDAAILQYSGGTTGTSKGAIGLHSNLVANVLQFRAWLVGIEDGKEVVLVAIPLFHVYGMVLGMLLSIACGASMVLIENSRDMKAILRNIRKYKVTIFPGVPSLYNAINQHPEVMAGKHNLRSIKACISGSAPLLKETKDRFEALTGGKLMEGYGLSEAPTATHCNPMLGENRPGSIGLPLPDVDARIVSLEDGMTVLSPGEIGELVISGPQVMKGYHNMPFETTNVLKDGWLYTGDIASMDQAGYFYIVDRKKDLIKPGGFQVWPREVEEIIKRHPKVLDVGVAGVTESYRGEIVKAWVVLKPGETSSEAEIRQFCSDELAPYKVPSLIEFRSELPKTAVGKILRRELTRQHYESLRDQSSLNQA
jgi:long-chain acyl-CoA synthetase